MQLRSISKCGDRTAGTPPELSANIADFVDRPIGRYSLGPTHLVWCHSATLCGSVHWGRYTEAHVDDLLARLAFSGNHGLAGGFDVFMDSRALESFEWLAWELLARRVRAQVGAWNRRIRRHAIVVDAGIDGVLIAGMLPVLGASYPFRFFTSTRDALAWLDRPELAAVLGAVDDLAGSARSASPVLTAFRHHLEQTLATASLAAAARALGQSERTLQRALRAEGTNWSGELRQARVRVAQALLVAGDAPLDTVARRVGLASASQLIALFGRATGQTPAQYRAGQRPR